jgi:hypothetical protein
VRRDEFVVLYFGKPKDADAFGGNRIAEWGHRIARQAPTGRQDGEMTLGPRLGGWGGKALRSFNPTVRRVRVYPIRWVGTVQVPIV